MLCNAKPPFLFDFHFFFSLVLNPSVSFAKREPSRFSADFMIESWNLRYAQPPLQGRCLEETVGLKRNKTESWRKLIFRLKRLSFRRDSHRSFAFVFFWPLGSKWASTPTDCSVFAHHRRARCPHRTKKVWWHYITMRNILGRPHEGSEVSSHPTKRRLNHTRRNIIPRST